MAERRKKEVYRVQMAEGKRNIIRQLLEEYDIQSAEDIQDALKDLLGGTIKEMMKQSGSMKIEVPQDRDSSFEPKVVKKRQKDISGIDQKIISMYANGMTTRQISETLMDIYGFEGSEGFISDVTDKILPQIEEWQQRPLDDIYPVIFIDAINYSVREDGIIRKLAA